MILLKEPLVIIANGDFPEHSTPLKKLKNAKCIVACDGAVDLLEKKGFSPDVIIGDLDSISRKNKEKYKEIIIETEDQSENDSAYPVKASETISANIKAGIIENYDPKEKSNPFK